MVHIQILDTYHSPILSRPLFQWPQLSAIFFYDALFKAFTLVAKSHFCIRIIGLVFKLIITIP